MEYPDQKGRSMRGNYQAPQLMVLGTIAELTLTPGCFPNQHTGKVNGANDADNCASHS
jgi:hypothetical protein